MSPFHQALLSAYVYGTMPYRVVANAWSAARGRAPVIVLFYHRVADEHPNPWTISNEAFTRHVDWLQRRFDLVSLAEAQQRIRSRANKRAAVSITFDDGYADNCEHALPLLIERRIPCTYFVSTMHVVDGEPFPHDVRLGNPLRPNTVEQLHDLARAGVEIGGHTRTHADLGKIDNQEQLFDEVVESAKDLEAVVDRPIRYFAFPYGLPANLNAEVCRMARDWGFDGVCSAYGGYNLPGDDPFHLQRFHGDPQFIRLKNWLTIDPRKNNVQRFDYKQRLPQIDFMQNALAATER